MPNFEYNRIEFGLLKIKQMLVSGYEHSKWNMIWIYEINIYFKIKLKN